jgi:hypothetical protein
MPTTFDAADSPELEIRGGEGVRESGRGRVSSPAGGHSLASGCVGLNGLIGSALR